MPKHLRRKILIDRRVQGALALRVFAYWCLLLGGIFALLVVFPVVVSWLAPSPSSPTVPQIVLHTFRGYWPILFAAGLMLPVILLDVLRVSHRFAGPMYRFHQAFKDLAEGKSVRPIELRTNDFWSDVANEFNRALVQVQPENPAAEKAAK